ncbi:MAG: hypothetical protein ACE5FD_04060 [Anaerolineae bacterium]
MTILTQLRQEIQPKERQSALLVILTALVALGLGWGVKTAVANQTRPFTVRSISAEIPAGWLVQEGTGELLLVARNPADMDQRYRILLLDGNSDLPLLANQHSQNRARLESTFIVLDETAIVADGRDGYKVTYAWVNTPAGQMPIIIEGVDYYFPVDDQALVISLEAAQTEFAGAFARFQQFRASVTYEAGG